MRSLQAPHKRNLGPPLSPAGERKADTTVWRSWCRRSSSRWAHRTDVERGFLDFVREGRGRGIEIRLPGRERDHYRSRNLWFYRPPPCHCKDRRKGATFESLWISLIQYGLHHIILQFQDLIRYSISDCLHCFRPESFTSYLTIVGFLWRITLIFSCLLLDFGVSVC